MAKLRSLQARTHAARGLPLRLRAALWAQALPVAEGGEVEHWAREAAADLARAPADSPWAPPIARALACVWPKLSRPQRDKLASSRRVREAFSRLAADEADAAGDPRLLTGLACAAESAQTPALIALLPRALAHDGWGATAAQRSLLGLALAWSDLPAESQAALDRAVVASAQQDAVLSDGAPLLAALIPLRVQAPAIAAWLEEGDEAALMALRAAVRRLAGSDAGARWALRLVHEPAVARAAVEAIAAPARVSAPAQARRRERLLPDWHLLLTPRRRTRLREASSRIWRAWLERSAGAALASLNAATDSQGPSAALAACMWTALTAPPIQRRRFLTGALAVPEPRVRSVAVRALAADDEPDPLLDDFAFDADPRVARTAVLRLRVSARERCADLRRRLVRSPDARMRRWAGSLAAITPGAWRDALAPGASEDWLAPAALRLDLARDRASALAALRAAVGAGEIPSRIAAIRLAVRAEAISEVELELLRLLASPVQSPSAARLTATAVAALGRLRTEAAREALLRFTAHPDDRIRASALEALGRQGAGVDRLHSALRDAAPRARANAVASLIELAPRDDAPRAALVEMLEAKTANCGFQRSALWVVEQRGLDQHASVVAEIAADSAADAALRARARRCARRLLARLSTPVSVSGAAPPEEPRP